MGEIGTYVLTHVTSRKFYVGSSGQLTKRIDRHYRELNSKKHHNKPLQDLWDKCPKLEISFFYTETRDDAYNLEQDLLDRYKSSDELLNIGITVKGGDNLTRNPNRKEIVEKILKSLKEKLKVLTSLERKLLYGRPGKKNGMFGRKHTEKTRKQMSLKKKGKPGIKGRKASPEVRARLSLMASKRIGVKNPFFGKKHTEEYKKRMSEKIKTLGLKPPNSRKVSVDGVEYESLTEGARQLGIGPALMFYRLKSKKDKYSGYQYID